LERIFVKFTMTKPLFDRYKELTKLSSDSYLNQDKALLKDIYKLLRNRMEKGYCIDSRSGVRLGTQWLIKKNPEPKEVDTSILLEARELLKLADYMDNFSLCEHKTVVEFYTIHYKASTANRYILNLATFCLGAYAAGLAAKNVKSKVVTDELVKVLTTDYMNFTRANANVIGDRAVRYYGFIMKTGVDNLFSTYYTREKVCKCNLESYSKLLNQVDMVGRRKLDKFLSYLSDDSKLKVYLNDAIIQYETNRVATQGAKKKLLLGIYNGFIPEKFDIKNDDE
jgi:hypothetical protein